MITPEPVVSRYHINEFIVDSEIVLPAAPLHDLSSTLCSPIEGSSKEVIRIRRESLSHLPSFLRKVRRQLAYDVGDGFLIEPKSDLALHVDLRGRNIVVDCAETRLSTAAAWCFHAGLGAATLLRGGLPLHGAGLEIENRYVALCASSGAGKSTLSWFLLERGARFANDDLVPTYPGTDGTCPYAHPSLTLMPKLQRETAEHYHLSLTELLPADYGTGEEEYHVPLPADKRRTTSGPLAAIFSLAPDTSSEDTATPDHNILVRRLSHSQATDFMSVNLHAEWIIGRYMNRSKLYRRCAHVADHVPVYQLSYRRSLSILPALHDTITELVRRGEQN